MKGFKIGDRVRAKMEYDGNKHIINKIGTVIAFDGKKGKNGHCWWCEAYVLEHLKNEKIVIYRKDNEVIALDKTTGKKGVAKCSPEDNFDFMVGAKLAFDRLSFKEVKRVAKPGEYIKIVNPFFPNGYGKGDILKVVKHMDRCPGLEPCVRVRGIEINILDKEYVVLEGYTPVEETDDNTIKVGDKVKITNGGSIYSSHIAWVEENVKDKTLIAKWSYGHNPYYNDGEPIETDDIFIVKAVEDDKLFIQIERSYDQCCYLIDIKGVEKC